MAKLHGLGEHQRKRFCSSLVNEIESEFCDMIKPKAKYMVESLRTFLTEDSNFYGLELLDSITSILEKYVDELEKENVCIGIMTLLTTDKNKLLKVNDTKIKQLFGDCPFNKMQNLTLMGEKLAAEFSREQFDFITNKTRNAKAEWNSIDCQTRSLLSLKQDAVPDYFYMEVEKIEKEEPKSSDHAFSMTYKEEIKNTSENWLEQGYDKYKHILPGFSKEEFCKSMFQILASNRSNNELQNELFEMLGFDAFELISEMLDNRKSIVDCGLNLFNSNAKKKPVENGYVKTTREGPHITSQVSVQLDSEKLYQKQLRKLEKKSDKFKNKDYNGDYSHYNNNSTDYGTSKTESLTKLARSAAAFTQQQYPHVHDSQKEVHVKMMICGQPTNVPNPKRRNKKIDANIRRNHDTFTEIDRENRLRS
ncbi:N-terminal helicase PWI domain [Popillia japonica]|uniref:N-terminal helicase PWI domain n=1 Tax=Popillia japonica TaxID=7064 RepID=A0AAW1MCL5_POPJA